VDGEQLTQATQARDGDEPHPAASAERRGGRGARDIILSMLVLLVPLALVVALFRFQGGESVQTVDTAPAIADAQAARFPLAVPTQLDSGWRPLSAVFQRSGGLTLRIGYLTPNGDTAQLVESNRPETALLDDTIGSRPAGTTRPIGGEDWQHYDLANGNRAFVLTSADRTLVVYGSASDAELGVLAASLR
jgi:hypothetical protein